MRTVSLALAVPPISHLGRMLLVCYVQFSEKTR